MLKLLFLPGAIFLVVILFRVIIPNLKIAPWKRMIDDAAYHRHRDNFTKSDEIIEKAIRRFPDKPQVYLDFFLNHSDSSNLKQRFEVLMDGYAKTGDTILAFFIGSTYLEHGQYDKALEYLDTDECRNYMLKKGTTLIPEIYLGKKDFKKAEEEYIAFYSELYGKKDDLSDLLSEMSPQDLVLLALIKKEAGEEYNSIMDSAPKSSVHTNMSWVDLLKAFQDKLSNLKPAKTGIDGDAGEFNRKRREYFQSRIALIQSYL